MEKGDMVAPPLDGNWRRSTRCESGGCVEVARLGDEVGMRDSTDPNSPVLLFTPVDWKTFVVRVVAGEFRL
jgi:hypothetical protein